MTKRLCGALFLLVGCSGPEQMAPPPPADEVARVAPRRVVGAAGSSESLCAGKEKDLLRGAAKGDDVIVRACLELGVDLDALDDDRRTALALAAQAGSVEVIRMLLEAGATIAPEGVSPLVQAVRHRNEEAVRLLLESGASVRGENSPLLVEAIEMGEVGIAQALLDHGADPNSKRGSSVSPMMVATLKCDESAVAMLLEAGADPNQATPAGRPIDVARNSGSRCAGVTQALVDVSGSGAGGFSPYEPLPNEPGGWKPSRPPKLPDSPRRPPA
jgi:ankyrin repeat protein